MKRVISGDKSLNLKSALDENLIGFADLGVTGLKLSQRQQNDGHHAAVPISNSQSEIGTSQLGSIASAVLHGRMILALLVMRNEKIIIRETADGQSSHDIKQSGHPAVLTQTRSLVSDVAPDCRRSK